MRTRVHLAAATTGLALIAGSVVAVVAPAGATTYYAYYGYAGGSQIKAADATITSDLSVQSTVLAIDANAADRKSTAKLTVAGVLQAGAVSTSTVVTKVPGGRQLTSVARTSGVSLLGGVITADAVTTTTVSKVVNGKLSSTGNTAFAGLHIAGRAIPLDVAKNTTIGVPGVATVSVNYVATASSSTATVGIGSGLVVSLLSASGDEPAGATVYLSPTYNYVASGAGAGTGHSVAGNAFGTEVDAKAGSVASVTSSPTAQSFIPVAGTNGRTTTTGVAGVHVLTALTSGAVTTAMRATNTKAGGQASTSSRVAHISLLGGLITADAITASAGAKAVGSKPVTLSGASSLGHLVIAGKAVPLSVRPNTVISLGGLGRVVLNEQVRKGNTVSVTALHLTLGTAAYGLAVGAQLQVAHASATAS